MSNFILVDDIIKYNELYSDESKEEVNYFNPDLFLYEVFDYCNNHKNNIYICNKKSYCTCIHECDCLDNSFIKINLNLEILSNNKCYLNIIFNEKNTILHENFNWCIFLLKELDDIEEEIIEIKKDDNKIYFNYDDIQVNFELDHLSKTKYGINIQFNYMSHSY